MRSFPILLFFILGGAVGPVHAQGALEPTAPPAPVMKTLDQVEARSPVSTADTISAAGSYYLTNDITGRLTIAANDVDLDLNGFTLTGASTVTLEIPSVQNVRVHNGTIRGSTSVSIGVSNSSNVFLENLRVLDGTNNAVQVVDHTGPIVVRNIHVDTTGSSGISVFNSGIESFEAIVIDNTVRNANSNTGITRSALSVAHTGTGDVSAVVTGNRVVNNRTNGLFVGAEGTGLSSGMVSGNFVSGNGNTGLRVIGNFVTAKNLAHENGTNYNLGSAPNAAAISALASAGPWNNIEQ